MGQSEKLNIVIGVLVVATIIAAALFGYQRFEQRQRTLEQLATFTATAQQATPESSVETIVNALKKLRDDYSAYEKGGISVEVRRKYDGLVSELQELVEKGYASSLNEMVIADIDATQDTAVISDMVRKLDDFIAQVDTDAPILASPRISDEARAQATERVTHYKQRVAAIEEEAKRKADEERKKAEEELKKAEEEAKRQAEKEARQAASHYENEYFSLDFPPEWEGKWSVGSPDDAGNRPAYRVIASGVANNPSGGGAETLAVVYVHAL